MKKAIKVSKKALSVTLALLMVFTSWVWFAPDKAEAAEGNKYYVKVYVNIYDGSDGYGGAYAVEETTGKPKNYSWATNDGWYGRINMTGFTVFGENGDYDAQDVSEALIRAEGKNSYYAMSGLSDNNAEGDWDSKRIDNEVYTFVLDSFPVEVFGLMTKTTGTAVTQALLSVSLLLLPQRAEQSTQCGKVLPVLIHKPTTIMVLLLLPVFIPALRTMQRIMI